MRVYFSILALFCATSMCFSQVIYCDCLCLVPSGGIYCAGTIRTQTYSDYMKRLQRSGDLNRGKPTTIGSQCYYKSSCKPLVPDMNGVGGNSLPLYGLVRGNIAASMTVSDFPQGSEFTFDINPPFALQQTYPAP